MPNSSSRKRIKVAILETILERGAQKTVCPSEIARQMDAENWRELMPVVREVADELAAQNKLAVTQKGKRIESAVAAVGPIRLGLP